MFKFKVAFGKYWVEAFCCGLFWYEAFETLFFSFRGIPPLDLCDSVWKHSWSVSMFEGNR